MKIAAFEFDYHIVQLCNFCMIFKGSKHHITVFTSEQNFQRISDTELIASCTWIVKGRETMGSFLDKHLSLINSNDVIYFNTIASNYKIFYKTAFTPPSILRIHNGHTYLKPFRYLHLPKSLFELRKGISYIIREMVPTLDFYYIRKIISRKHCFVTLNDYYRETYAIQEHLIGKEKIFPCIPFATSYAMAKELDPARPCLSVSIPGAIDERKRNYQVVFQAVKHAIPHLRNPISLSLTGMPVGGYGKKIIDMFKQLEGPNFQLKSYSAFLAQETYNTILQEADLFLAPMIVEHQFRIYTEIYGKSKSSGNVSDMISYGKLVIFPTTFHNDPQMAAVVDQFDSAESLAAILIEYANNRSHLLERSRHLREFLIRHYAPEVLRTQFENHCHELLGISG